MLKAYAGYDPARIRTHDARFTAPVWPGETIAVELWRDAGVVSFQARAKERDVLVVRNGRTILS